MGGIPKDALRASVTRAGGDVNGDPVPFGWDLRDTCTEIPALNAGRSCGPFRFASHSVRRFSMFSSPIVVLALLCTAIPAVAQMPARRPLVRASGEGIISIRPDQVKVNVGVTNQAQTAQEAADQNASLTSAVLGALRGLLGNNADIRTLGYSLNPVYSNTPTPSRAIIGYMANNTVQVTLTDLSQAGRVIDTAASAGATNVQGLVFGLRDPQPARIQALRQATMQARTNAEAIATGLGMKLGSVMIAEEGSRVTPVITDGRGFGAAAPTPIEPGNVDVRAYVAIEAEMVN